VLYLCNHAAASVALKDNVYGLVDLCGAESNSTLSLVVWQTRNNNTKNQLAQIPWFFLKTTTTKTSTNSSRKYIGEPQLTRKYIMVAEH